MSKDNIFFKARRLPQNPGQAAWNAILPKMGGVSRLTENRDAEWLVIGAGFAGLSAARRLNLACPGGRVIVLDAVPIAEGSAGRNSGFMIDLPHDLSSAGYGGGAEGDRRAIVQNRAAIAFARETVRDLGVPAEAFRACGKINAAASERGAAHNRRYAAHLAALGEECEFLDAANMCAVTGTGYYFGGLFTPGTVMLQPALYIRSLTLGLNSGGVRVFENSPVISLSRRGGIWRAETPDGSVSAPKVILAVNGHAESFGFFRRRLIHIFTYGSMTRALTASESRALGGEPNWGLVPADPMGATIRRVFGTGGDRVIIRRRFTCEPNMRPSGRTLASVWLDHDRGFAARFPMLEGVAMEHRWGGHLCLSRNGVGAFGEVEKGLFSACCQNGLGLAKGTLHGMCAADLALGRTSELLDQLVAAPSPSRLPPGPVAALAASAKIRWGEWWAGKEF